MLSKDRRHLRIKAFIICFTFTLFTTLLGFFLSNLFIKPVYKTDISLIIRGDSNKTKNNGDEYEDNILLFQKLAPTYSEILKSRTVTQDVINKLNLNINVRELQKSISISQKKNSEFLIISVSAHSAKKSVEIANQIAISLKETSLKILREDFVNVLDEPKLPSKSLNINIIVTTIFSFLIGLFTSLAFILSFKKVTKH
ncbi:YveK family protein [Desnuesiella massiliensis]|uniref:YveK family protein n=1 Tax=Desnuesiella massiliensis TaxID=1650662 RepID=UPI0006E2236B|nr:Wzz/FepE/Etk N-terminal domain-containing protein [Desnuesiella massiliensis]